MIAIGYSVLNHRLKLLLTVVHVKHLFLYVAVAVLIVSLDKSCNQTTKDDVRHQFQTLYMDVRVREVAHEMGDKKLFA